MDCNSDTTHPASPATAPQINEADFWYGLVDEKAAAKFLNLSVRCLQGFRYKGGGPRFVRVSSRCVKYRRVDCREWSETKLRTSTSDSGAPATVKAGDVEVFEIRRAPE